MFSTKEVNTEQPQGNGGKGFSYGIAKIKITDYKLTQSSQSDKVKLEFFIEDDTPVEDGYEYEGVFGKHVAQFKTARVAFESPLMCKDGVERMNNWNSPSDKKFITKLQKDFAVIANDINCRPQVDAVEASNIEDYITKVVSVIKDNYFYAVIKAEEVESQDGEKTFLNRTFKSYVKKEGDLIVGTNMISKPVEGSELIITGKVHTLTHDNRNIIFDANNVWDYKPLAKPDSDKVENPVAGAGSDDLAF